MIKYDELYIRTWYHRYDPSARLIETSPERKPMIENNDPQASERIPHHRGRS